jgi:hypothetical protein
MIQLTGMTHGRAYTRQHEAPSNEPPTAIKQSVSHVRLLMWLKSSQQLPVGE